MPISIHWYFLYRSATQFEVQYVARRYINFWSAVSQCGRKYRTLWNRSDREENVPIMNLTVILSHLYKKMSCWGINVIMIWSEKNKTTCWYKKFSVRVLLKSALTFLSVCLIDFSRQNQWSFCLNLVLYDQNIYMNGYLLAGYRVAVIVFSFQHLTSVLLIFC